MRAGWIITGLIMIIIGILMMLMLWPLMGFETKESFDMNDIKKGEKTTYIGEITGVTESGEWYVIELDEGVVEYYTKEKHFAPNDNVVIVIEFGGNASNWDENEYISIERIPTFGGVLGLAFIMLGLIITIVGFVVRKRSIEDFLHFETQISIKSQQAEQNMPSELEQYHPQKDVDNTKTTTIKIPKIERTTCPKCNNAFDVNVPTRPLKISCPHCGQKGILK